MDETGEYGLTGTGKPPWWFARSGRLKALWINPIFQKALKRNRIRPYVPPLTAFIVTFGYSLIVCLESLYMHIGYTITDVTYWGMAVVIIPGGSLIYIAYILLYVSCLITTPLNLARDLGKDEMNPVLSTPVTDQEFYYGESLPSFVKSVNVVQTVVAALIGLVVPFIFLILVPAGYVNLSRLDFALAGLVVFGAVPIYLAILVVDLILMSLLMSLTSGLYAFRLPATGAIFAALVHYGVISGVSGMFSGGMSGTVLGAGVIAPLLVPGSEAPWILLFGIGAYILQKALLVGGCLVTASIGVSSYASKRRGGINYRK